LIKVILIGRENSSSRTGDVFRGIPVQRIFMLLREITVEPDKKK